jgi:predicted transcriptional regulator
MVNLSNDRREGKAPLRLGSLVDLVRELLTGRYANAEFLEEFELRLEQINKSQVKLATSSELLEESKSSGQKIKELLDRVVELELDITRDTWSERQALMKQMQALGPNKQECKRRVFDHICDFFGVDLGATKGNTIVDKGRERARRLMNRSKGDWLVPGFLRQNRDAIFFGDSGSGKTTISLDMIRSLTMNRTFADGKQPCQGQKKTLFIATDGGVTAESVLMDYINDLGLMHHDQFWEKFIWWSSDEDSSSPPWTLTLGNMIKLQERLTEGDIDLVVIDSLKAVTTGTDYSIDDRNIGHVMRLMQSIVTPHAGLVWIHHTNKSGKSSSHSAGGVTDIIEVVSAAFQVQREWEDDKPTQRSTMKVQKLRGEDSRQFNFTFDWRHGVCPEIEMDYEAREIEARVTDYPQMIMVAIRDSEFGRMSRGSLSDAIGASANTVDNYLQELKKSGLIKQARSKGWCLTGKGTQVAENFSRKRLESQLSSDF